MKPPYCRLACSHEAIPRCKSLWPYRNLWSVPRGSRTAMTMNRIVCWMTVMMLCMSNMGCLSTVGRRVGGHEERMVIEIRRSPTDIDWKSLTQDYSPSMFEECDLIWNTHTVRMVGYEPEIMLHSYSLFQNREDVLVLFLGCCNREWIGLIKEDDCVYMAGYTTSEPLLRDASPNCKDVVRDFHDAARRSRFIKVDSSTVYVDTGLAEEARARAVHLPWKNVVEFPSSYIQKRATNRD